MGKHGKTWENVGKRRKTLENDGLDWISKLAVEFLVATTG